MTERSRADATPSVDESLAITIKSSTTTIVIDGVGRLFVEEFLRAISAHGGYHRAFSLAAAVNGAPIVSMMVQSSSIEQWREPKKRGTL